MKISLSQLILNPDNPRLIKEDKFKLLCKSITDFPQMLHLRPIVVDEKMNILGGNMRYLALQKLGHQQVDVTIAEGLTDEQKREFIIKDNNSFGEYDWDAISAEWTDFPLKDWGIDLPDDWLKEPQQLPQEGEFYGEPPAEPVTVLGDLYELNGHRIHCQDSTDSEAVGKLMEGKKADMVFTDPPYGVSYESNRYKVKNPHGKIINDDTLLDFMPVIERYMQQDSAIYVCASHQTVHYWRALIDEYFDYKNLIVWKKNSWSMGDLTGAFAGQHELIFFAHKGRVILRGERSRDVWEFNRDPPKDHPTQKPVELVQFAVEKASDINNLIVDPFLGSGTTLIACQQTRRTCYGQEISPAYMDVIISRWTLFMRTNNLPYQVKRNGELLTETELKEFTDAK